MRAWDDYCRATAAVAATPQNRHTTVTLLTSWWWQIQIQIQTCESRAVFSKSAMEDVTMAKCLTSPLHPKHLLKSCRVWLKLYRFGSKFGRRGVLTANHEHASEEKRNLTFKHHRQIWHFFLVLDTTCIWLSQGWVTSSCSYSCPFLQLQPCILALKAIFGLILTKLQ